MDSTVVMRVVMAGLIAGCAWTVAAYGRAFFRMRRPAYLLLALLGLVFISAAGFALAAIADPDVVVEPLLVFVGAYLGISFAPRSMDELPDYTSPLDIMLFRPGVRAARRNSRWVTGAMTVGLLSAVTLLLMFTF